VPTSDTAARARKKTRFERKTSSGEIAGKSLQVAGYRKERRVNGSGNRDFFRVPRTEKSPRRLRLEIGMGFV
jgi:hypothetical protein